MVKEGVREPAYRGNGTKLSGSKPKRAGSARSGRDGLVMSAVPCRRLPAAPGDDGKVSGRPWPDREPSFLRLRHALPGGEGTHRRIR